MPGHFVRLEPLTPVHAAGLAEHADAQTVALLSRGGPEMNDKSGLAGYIGRLNALPGRVNWAVVRAGERIAGRISFGWRSAPC